MVTRASFWGDDTGLRDDRAGPLHQHTPSRLACNFPRFELQRQTPLGREQAIETVTAWHADVVAPNFNSKYPPCL